MSNAFDHMAAAGSLLGIGMQTATVTLDLRDTLDQHGGKVDRAAADRGMLKTWTEAEPETRSALLLSFAWGSREAEITEDDRDDAAGYAADLNRYAREFTGDSEAFHGKGFPAMPLPGRAGALASSLGFDRDDVGISLEAVLLLLSKITPGPSV